jgi:hypothetical protein
VTSYVSTSDAAVRLKPSGEKSAIADNGIFAGIEANGAATGAVVGLEVLVTGMHGNGILLTNFVTRYFQNIPADFR